MQNPTSKHKNYIKKAFYVLVLIFLFLSAFLVGKYRPTKAYQRQKTNPISPKKQAIKLSSICKDPNNENFKGKLDCYSKAYYKLTQQQGPEYVFNSVDELKKIDSDVRSSCHPIGHAIGWGVYDLNPAKWKDSIKTMSSDCSFGVHMGMIERYAASHGGGGLDKQTVKTICDSSGGCNHGIGHVALVVTDNDIGKALDLCSALTNAHEERHWCYTGVFMERRTMQNLSEHTPVSSEKLKNWALELDNYVKECGKYKNDVYISCWSGLALPASIKLKEPIHIFDLCNSTNIQEAANKCRREAVNYIIERHVKDISTQKYICTLAPAYDTKFSQDCYNQTAYNGILLNEPKNLGVVMDYCDSVPDNNKQDCFVHIHSGLSVLRNPVDTSVVCEKAPVKYRDICMGQRRG